MSRLLLFLLPFFLIGCDSKPAAENITPVAEAGQYQYLETGSTVYLDGSASSDGDGDTLRYTWSFNSTPSGSSALLESANTVTPNFTADVEGDYSIKLTVNDGELNSAPDYVTISTVTFVEPSTGPFAANEIFTPSNVTQQRKMLVIRMAFSDQAFDSDETVWQEKHFGTQSGQLNHYFQENSHGQFEFVPVLDEGNVTGGITTVTFSENHPDPDVNSFSFTADLHYYLKQAIVAVDADGFKFSTYDSDANGAITPDELIVIFIMAGEEDAYSGGIYDVGIWAHQWCTESTYTPVVDGVSVMGCSTNGNYAIFGERHHDSSSVSHDATIGIIAHELGHSTFSLPDLYDTNSDYGGISYYGLMASGTWGQQGTSVGAPGDTPTHMCAWSKIDVGWYSSTSSSNDINASIDVNATGTDTYNIIKAPVSGSTNEYFLIENRGTSGYDAGLKRVTGAHVGGLAIWHVDADTISSNLFNNSVNDNSAHKGVDLEEADLPSLDNSRGDPTKNLYYSGNKTEFTPNTLPNTNLYDNSRSYIFFTDVSAPSDTMTLRINNPL